MRVYAILALMAGLATGAAGCTSLSASRGPADAGPAPASAALDDRGEAQGARRTIPPSEQAQLAREAEAAAAPAQAAPRLPLKQIIIERVSELPQQSAVTDDKLLAAADGKLGTDVTLEELRGIATGMERIFRDEGYPYVRVVLPPQRVEAGTVRLQVIEGQIEGVVVLGSSPTAKRQAEAQLARLNGLGPVPVSEVEQVVTALSDVPGLNARVSLARGTEGPGTMRIIAEAEREEPRFLINAHNWGSENLGREGVTGLVRVPGLALFGDEFQASFFTTREWGEQFVGQLAYERTLTSGGLKVRVEGTYGQAEPSGTVATLGATTESVTANLEVSHPIYRDRDLLVDLYGGLDYANLKGELFQKTVLLSDDRTRVAYLGAEAEAEVDGFSARGHIEARKGVGILRASKKGDRTLARTEARPNAWSLLGEVNVTTPSFQTLRLDVTARGQHARDPLMAVEEFSFGNYTIVRGYDPGAATGDAAIAVAAEIAGLGYRPFNSRTHVEFFGFFDIGEYWNRDRLAVQNRTLASWGTGVRINIDDYARAEFTYAEPLREPLGLNEGVPGPRVLFSLTTNVGQLAKDAYQTVADLFPAAEGS
ncbi:ShlB/FhaC/HecB family hemolysin secretion/activation protein [Pyruvatibacter mobilis]|uniref:ShlB/FhaC/HecB family hemolysin secretion/activation protein n=1 Tax=Pyruvatibacter mobilis TaxID=1712261 RepID=UPI003C79BB9F